MSSATAALLNAAMASIYNKLRWRMHGPRPLCPCCSVWAFPGSGIPGSGKDQKRVRRIMRKKMKRQLRSELDAS